jgi:Collagenase and related proteases
VERGRALLKALGFRERDVAQVSGKRFPDGAQYRVEIPSVEGPRVLEAVLEACRRYDVRIDRVSQGSGIMLLTDQEIREMAAIGREAGIEVSLFVGPRGPFDIGAQPLTLAGKNIGWRVEGCDQLAYALEDVFRACDLGIRSVLVADEGVLWLIDQAKKRGELPENLVVKVSVLMGACNPVSIALMEKIGAGTFNVPTDLTLPRLSAIRQAVEMPLDIYVEAPDDFGGFVRHYEIPEIVRVASPVYIKFGLRNAPNIYPSGSHLEETAIRLAVERVRRAKLGLDVIARFAPELVRSAPGAKDLGIPV